MNTMTITIMSLWDASTHEYDVITDEWDQHIKPEVLLEKVFVRQQDDTKDVPNIPSMCAGDIVSVSTIPYSAMLGGFMDRKKVERSARFLCTANGWKRLTLELFYQWTTSSSLERMLLARK